MSKSIIYLLHFAAYAILILLIGKSGFKKTNNEKDFFVANNSFGLVQCVFAYCATWFSAASMQGVPGTIFAYGLSTIFYSILPWLSGAVLHIILANKIKDYNIMTVPEFFKIRYGSKYLQAIGGVFVLIVYTLYLIIPIVGFGIVISALIDINYVSSLFLIYIFIIYATFGGLFSVGKTHFFNFGLIVISIFIAVYLTLKINNGIGGIIQGAKIIDTLPFKNFPQSTEIEGLLSFTAKGQVPVSELIMSFFGWGLGLSSNPQYITLIMAAKNKKTAINMLKISIISLSIIYVCLVILGLGFRVIAPSIQNISSVDEVFPYIINNQMYSSFSGIIFIGICAAALSTANSQLLIVSSGFTYDIYKNIFNENIEEDRFLNLTRISIFIISSIALLLSLRPPTSLLRYGDYLWGVFASTFLVPIFGGVFWKKANKYGVIASFICGSITFLFFIIFTTIHPAFPGVIFSSVSFYFTSLIADRRVNNEI